MEKAKLFLGSPIQSWVGLGGAWMLFMLNANTREIINRLMPYITDTFSITATQAGYISSVAFLGLAIGSIPMARWADSKGYIGWRKKTACLILGIGYLLFTALCGVSFLTVSFGILLAFQFCRGFFCGGADGLEVSTAAEWFPNERTGFALGAHHTAYPWGTFIGGLIVTAVLATVGDANWQVAFFIFPVLGAIIWPFWYKYSSAKNYKKFEETTEAHGMTTPLSLNKTEEEKVEVPKGALGRCLKNPNVSLVAIGAMLHNAAYLGFCFWMPLYLAFVAGYNFATAASLSIIFTITGGLGQIVWGTLADKFGTKRVLIICSVWIAVAFFLMKNISLGLYALVACQLFLGCCSNAVYPVMYNYAAKSTEKGVLGTANGVINSAMYFGGFIATPVVGFLIDLGGGFESVSGYLTALYVMAGAALVAAIIFALFTREPNGPRAGKGWALVSLKSCNLSHLEKEK